MDKLLVYARSDVLNDRNSVGKKVMRQYRALSGSFDTYLLSQSENRIILTHGDERETLVTVGKGDAMRKRFNQCAAELVREQDIRRVFIRYPKSSFPFIQFLKRMKADGRSVILEFPTYPYDREIRSYGKTLRNRLIFYIDRIYRTQLNKYVFAAASYSQDTSIFGIPALQIRNGVEVCAISVRQPAVDGGVHVIAVAEMQRSHGYDRFISGLKQYYDGRSDREIIFHLVGEGPERASYEAMVRNFHLEDRVVFHGYRVGAELDAVYNQCTLALESLGIHRTGLTLSSSLKSREYLSKGLPLITSCEIDVIPEGFRYVFHVPGDESPVDMGKLMAFYDEIYRDGQEKVIRDIRAFAEENCDIGRLMQPVVRKFYE